MGELDAWRAANRSEITQRAQCFRDALAEAPGWGIEAIGAYFAYVRHPFAHQGSEPVARHLAAQAGVLTVPGSFFGPGQEQHLRMAFANVDAAAIGQLSARLRAATDAPWRAG